MFSDSFRTKIEQLSGDPRGGASQYPLAALDKKSSMIRDYRRGQWILQNVRVEMKFTIARGGLEHLLKGIVSRRHLTKILTLSACAARVFAECNGVVAGIEALVFADGAVTLPTAGKFRDLLKTYRGTRFLTIEGDAGGLRIKNLWMPIVPPQQR